MLRMFERLDSFNTPEAADHVRRNSIQLWKFVRTISGIPMYESMKDVTVFNRGLVELKGYNFWAISITGFNKMPPMKVLLRFKK